MSTTNDCEASQITYKRFSNNIQDTTRKMQIQNIKSLNDTMHYAAQYSHNNECQDTGYMLY